MMYTVVLTNALFPVVFAIELDSLILSINAYGWVTPSYILLNSIVVRPGDHGQPNSIASIEDKSVERADTGLLAVRIV